MDHIGTAIGVSARTVRDWRREKINMSLRALKRLSKKMGAPIPKDIKILSPFWYVPIGARLGASRMLKKYGRVGGDPNYRKKMWREWWEKTGKYLPSPILNSPRPFHKPRYSSSLAEFIGIMIGDGGLTKYQAKITLHHKDDREYIDFVSSLIKKLFEVPIKICHRPNISVKELVVSRKGLVDYLHKMGLPIGDKIRQNIDIPGWIKNSKNYSLACIRGLVDTDGSIFTHKYESHNKQYGYKKLDFSTASPHLMSSASKIFKKLGIKTYINKTSLRIENTNDMQKYFDLIGSHNPKHIKNYYTK